MHESRSAVLALAALAILVAGPVRAAPYPKSRVITGITWDSATYRFGGVDGDLWPTTTGDGRGYTAWGDGKLGCPAYVSYGTVP